MSNIDVTESDRKMNIDSGQAGTKAMLTFDLSDQEQKQKLQRMLAADELCLVIWDIKQLLRDVVKHDRKPAGESVTDTLAWVEEAIYNLLDRWPHARAVMEEWK